MLTFHVTARYFALALVVGVVGLAIALVAGPVGVAGTVAAMAFTVWLLRRSETHGFVRSGQMRRAFEPERHFNGIQTMVLFGMLMVMTLVAAFALVR